MTPLRTTPQYVREYLTKTRNEEPVETQEDRDLIRFAVAEVI